MSGGQVASALLIALLLAACARSERTDVSYETPQPNDNAKQSRDAYTSPKQAAEGGLIGDRLEGSFSLGSLFDWFGAEDGDVAPAAAPTDIRVNGHLWAAALDAVSFMPIDDADPASGIIRTGWFTDPEEPNERFRVNVFILSGELRDDGVRVGVFRQRRDADGAWRDVEPHSRSATDLEDIIVRRARDLGTSRA